MQKVCLCVLLAMLCVVVYGQESAKPSDVKEKVPVVKGSAPDLFTFIDDEGKPTHAKKVRLVEGSAPDLPALSIEERKLSPSRKLPVLKGSAPDLFTFIDDKGKPTNLKKVRLVEGSAPDLSALSNEERKPTPSRKLPVLKGSAPDLFTFIDDEGNPIPVRNVRLVERNSPDSLFLSMAEANLFPASMFADFEGSRMELSKKIIDSEGNAVSSSTHVISKVTSHPSADALSEFIKGGRIELSKNITDSKGNPVSSITQIISKVTPRPSVDARSELLKETASELFTPSDAEGDPTRSRRAAAVGDYQKLTNYFDEPSGTESSRTVDCKYLKSLMLRVAGGALSYFREVFSNKGDDGVKGGIIPLPVSAIFGSPYLQGIEMKDLLPKIANSVAQFIGVQDPEQETRTSRSGRPRFSESALGKQTLSKILLKIKNALRMKYLKGLDSHY